jgi:hypothetical protein
MGLPWNPGNAHLAAPRSSGVTPRPRSQQQYALRVGHANILPERPRGRELRWDSHFFATVEQLTKAIANVLTPDGQQSPNTRWNHCADR